MNTDKLSSGILQRLMAAGDAAPEHVPEWREAYHDAAAVLASFEPTRLQPFRHEQVPEAWHKLLADCEPVDAPVGPGRWRLRSGVRRTALRRLHEREQLAAALASNPVRDRDDPLQVALESVIEGSTPQSMYALRREQLAAYGVVREWFDGILPVPAEETLRDALPIAEVMSPLHRLAEGFVGRQSELAKLEDFVGVLDARTLYSSLRRGVELLGSAVSGRVPLFVHGPGGVGKSTLIAKFVLEHVGVAEKVRMPFAYLDVDRPAIDPQRPVTLLLEAMRQLSVQFPEEGSALSKMIDELEGGLIRQDRYETYKSVSPQHAALQHLLWWIDGPLARLTRQPLLLVVDTFEEVQFLGLEAVRAVWHLLELLQSSSNSVRVVVAGRALPRHLDCKPLRLTELDLEGARELLRQRFHARHIAGGAPPPDRQIDQVIGIVGRSPMSLRLAAQIVGQHGMDKLRGIETRSFLFLQLRAEKVQAQLYGRILAHIHDASVRKLAYPGLVVRRITPAVIREVLAGPCGVPLDTPDAANLLFDALTRELALFEPDVPAEVLNELPPDAPPPAVRHRLDVRRMMLRDLLANVPTDTVRRIDRAAVDYYTAQPGPRSRAEEIYHRLRLGEPVDTLGARWMEGVGEFLRTAPEELPPREQLWLTTRLGATPPPELLAQADLETWEENVARDAQRALEGGSPRVVIDLVRGRDDRTPASPLFRLEAEAHRLLGDDSRARECALRGIESASAAGESAVALDLHLFVAAVDEGKDKVEAAMARLDAARPLVGDDVASIDALRLNTTRIRLRRLSGKEFDGEREELIEQVSAQLTPTLQAELRGRPALLRELVAEIGDRRPELLREGLEVVGLELADVASRRELQAVIDDNGFEWPVFLDSLGGPSGIARRVGEVLQTGSARDGLVDAVLGAYRAAVAASIKPRSNDLE